MTHEELRDILNADIGDIPSPNSPDPAWDYYQAWKALTEFRDNINDVIKFISQHETSSRKTDAAISIRLDQLQEEFEDIVI